VEPMTEVPGDLPLQLGDRLGHERGGSSRTADIGTAQQVRRAVAGSVVAGKGRQPPRMRRLSGGPHPNPRERRQPSPVKSPTTASSAARAPTHRRDVWSARDVPIR
jgi:hypothetical protein